jgi:hypothetical protein
MQNVKISVIDMLGNQVTILDSGMRNAGSHNLTWDAKDAASGVYFIKMTTPEMTLTSKVVLMR